MKSNSLRYSVIIPTINEAQVIEERILHVRSLNPEAEIIVADGGSTDNTLEIAKSKNLVKTLKKLRKTLNLGLKIVGSLGRIA